MKGFVRLLVGGLVAAALVAGALLLQSPFFAAAPGREPRCAAASAEASGSEAAPAARTAIRGELIVFAAASLQKAFGEVAESLRSDHPDLRVSYNFAGSSVLRTQLAHGAHADLFASADEPNMRRAQEDGLIAGPARAFARNELVIIASTRAVPLSNAADLARPGLKLVLAQPDVPAGNYAREALARLDVDPTYGAGFAGRVLGNVVSEESNVRQVVTKIALGEADAGIAYSSDLTPAARSKILALPFPEGARVVAKYPIALVRGGGCPTGSEAFVELLLSPAGQAILTRHGFRPAVDESTDR